MAFRFPSFEKGTKGTLLDSAVAKTVKRFIEAWNNVRIVRGAAKDELTVTDSNVVLSLSGSEGGGTEGAAVEVVQGSDGKLVKAVKHSTATTPTAFPTALKVVNGTTSITLDSTGITMTDTAGSGKSLTLPFSALMAGKSVSLRVDDYCDGTTAKSQQHLATAPYV
jgi:hypothetical protein